MDKVLEKLIRKLNSSIEMPSSLEDKKLLFRALVNIREPKEVDNEFLELEREYLQSELSKNIVDIENLNEIKKDMYLWQGDITRLKVDAIVNAANSKMLGCFIPNHRCIDNAIHTYAGVELRLECDSLMKAQGYDEATGKAKITKAYNLPSKYIIHTVGPIVTGGLREEHKELLKSCYTSCLELADKNNLSSIAFCCISTGEFCFPNREAADIAVKTVQEYKNKTGSKIKVIFNVFKDIDLEIYKNILE